MEDFTPTTELEMLANGDTITHHVLRPTFTVRFKRSTQHFIGKPLFRKNTFESEE